MHLLEPRGAVFFVGFIAYVAIRGRFQSQLKEARSAERRVDAIERVLLVIVFLTSLVIPLVYLTTPLLSFADYALPAASLWAGAATMVGALVLFWRAHADLGASWSVSLEIREAHRLVTEGVYRRVRHPMYSAIVLFGLAQGLLLENAVAGWSALAGFLPMVIIRTPREERMMLEHFGDEYREYMARTGRLLPRWRRHGPRSEPGRP